MSQRPSLRILVAASALAILAIVFFPTTATACSSLCQVCWDLNCVSCDVHAPNDVWCRSCPIQQDRLSQNFLSPPMPITTVEMLSANRARISIFGYATTFMQASATSCLVALSPMESVTNVTTVQIVNSDSGHPLNALRFAPDAEASNALGALAGDQDPYTWSGFATTLRRDVPAGIRTHFEVMVTLAPGTTPEQLLREVEAASFGTGGYTLGEDHDHDFIRRLERGGVLLIPEGREAAPLTPRHPLDP